MKQETPLLKRLIVWFNTKNEITRKEMTKEFNEECHITLDCYRNYLCQAGYMKWEAAGKYTRLKSIPEDLTEKQIRKEAYKK